MLCVLIFAHGLFAIVCRRSFDAFDRCDGAVGLPLLEV